MLTKSLIVCLLIILIPLVMVVLVLWMNELPWTSSPGFKARLAHYTSHNIAKTAIDASYSELTTRYYSLSEEQLKNEITKAVDKLEWEIVNNFEQGQNLKAVVTTQILRFKDDVVIELQKQGDDIYVQLKSSSRVGKGDLGTNTRHILDFYEMLERQIKQAQI